MKNAREEFIHHIGSRDVLCAKVDQIAGIHRTVLESHTLKVNYTEEEFRDFLDELNFEYDSGYGLVEIGAASGTLMVLGQRGRSMMVVSGGLIDLALRSLKN